MENLNGTAICYKDRYYGDVPFFYRFKYQASVTLFSTMPGGLGHFFRRTLFPSLFKRTGKGIFFGQDIQLRYPWKIEVGEKVTLEDNTFLDAGNDPHTKIKIGDNCFIGRNTILQCKGGEIEIGDNCYIGPNTTLLSESTVKMGKFVFISGHAFILAGENHPEERCEIPTIMQSSISKGGIIVDDDVRIGPSSTLLDGVRVGKGAIIEAGSLVHERIRPLTVNAGVPTQLIKRRD